MRTGIRLALIALGVGLTGLVGCGGGPRDEDAMGSQSGVDSSGVDTGTVGTGGGFPGCGFCSGNAWVGCDPQGEPVAEVDCFDEACVDGRGCLPCAPGSQTCVDNQVFTCTDEGQPGELVETCDAAGGFVCHQGTCTDACTAAADTPSNLGCEFFAVDLPNTRGLDDASQAEWGVVLANAGPFTVSVVIERNTAALGQPITPVVVEQVMVPTGGLQTIQLPRAEITGWVEGNPEPPGPPGTFISPNAFRIQSTGPIVVYQFNNFTNNFSTDASLLLPSHALGVVHRVIGYPTANPISVPGLTPPGIPDRSSVAVVAVHPDTAVKVRPSTTTATDGMTIPMAGPGDEINVTLGVMDVLNVASTGIPGDMTGTIIESNKPVSVFSTGERAIGPVLLDPPPPPGYVADDLCCTDHMEEQIFPVSSLGTDFVITRSPIRSSGGYAEPDILRFLAVAEPATVTTNMPPPWSNFTLQPGEVMNAWTDKDIVVESTAPIAIGQMLVSQGFTTAALGDPSLTIFPAVDQHRDVYVFLTPPSWTQNYFVIAGPVPMGGNDMGGTGSYTLDGGPLPADCIREPAGMIGTVEYEAIRCPVSEGSHRLVGDQRFGLTAYGYGSAGSYAYAGGADVRPIYEPPAIP